MFFKLFLNNFNMLMLKIKKIKKIILIYFKKHHAAKTNIYKILYFINV
jgi:hypothetical protein